ncbi:MAG: hypothetical protein R3D05_14715 [Dongiaceae bacterium]
MLANIVAFFLVRMIGWPQSGGPNGARVVRRRAGDAAGLGCGV